MHVPPWLWALFLAGTAVSPSPGAPCRGVWVSQLPGVAQDACWLQGVTEFQLIPVRWYCLHSVAGTLWHSRPVAQKGARRILVFLFSHHISHFSLSSCHQRQNVPPDEAFPDSWLLPHKYWMSKWQRHHQQQLSRASVTVMGHVALTHSVGAATHTRQGQGWARGQVHAKQGNYPPLFNFMAQSCWGASGGALSSSQLWQLLLCRISGLGRGHRSQNTPGPCGRHWQNREQGPCPPRSEKLGGEDQQH